MKRFFVTCITPLLIALIATFYLLENKQLNTLLFNAPEQTQAQEIDFRFIENLNDNAAYEERFFKSGKKSETIFLLGSSELTSATEATPFNFISDRFTTQVIGLGHAGNQCLSMYAQLLANHERLENAPIVIILSPGWFQSKDSKGTSSEIFLEYNSERYLQKILEDTTTTWAHPYLFKRVAELYNDFSSPSLELKLMNFEHQASKSFIHAGIYSPLLFLDNQLLNYKKNNFLRANTNSEPFTRLAFIQDSVEIKWDSIFAESAKKVLSNSTNNPMGISDSYYTEFIHGKTGKMDLVPEYVNKELEDFKMLMKLLMEKKVNASFVISPLNPLYYKNLIELQPIMNIIEGELKKGNFPYLNLLETDGNKYDKALLRDVMHMSDYGWYKVDEFIIETYHLNKWKKK